MKRKLLIGLIIGFFIFAAGCTKKVEEQRQPENPETWVKDKIVFTDSNYFLNLIELYYEQDTYDGVEVEIMGFLYIEEDWEKDEFLLGRFMISCCEDDMDLIGLMCKYDKASELVTDNWYMVKGIFRKATPYPYIEVVEIITIEKPADPFIHANI